MRVRKGESMKYRKKPVVVEAFKWCGDNTQSDDPVWIKEAIEKGDVYFSCEGTTYCNMRITTLEGIMSADLGDYIIRGIKGEIYPCKPDIFEATYEKVEG